MEGAGRHQPSALVLVGGHESAGGRALPALSEHAGLAGVRPSVVAVGRELERALETALGGRSVGPVVVVPMTLGRDPRLVADTGRLVRWAARGQRARRIALASPLGTTDHLVGWLRAACRRLHDDDASVLIAALPADPFDDAELYRIAALVRTYGRHRIVEVGLRSSVGGLDEGIERCRRLGARHIAIVPAEFGTRVDVAGPLLSSAVVAQLVTARVAEACHRLVAHGEDGVAAALAAEHLHGFAHSHAGGEPHPYHQPHDHFQATAG